MKFEADLRTCRAAEIGQVEWGSVSAGHGQGSLQDIVFRSGCRVDQFGMQFQEISQGRRSCRYQVFRLSGCRLLQRGEIGKGSDVSRCRIGLIERGTVGYTIELDEQPFVEFQQPGGLAAVVGVAYQIEAVGIYFWQIHFRGIITVVMKFLERVGAVFFGRTEYVYIERMDVILFVGSNRVAFGLSADRLDCQFVFQGKQNFPAVGIVCSVRCGRSRPVRYIFVGTGCQKQGYHEGRK